MPSSLHYSVDLQSMHGLRCYDNIMRTRNVSEYMLVLALCLVYYVSIYVCVCFSVIFLFFFSNFICISHSASFLINEYVM